MKHKLFSVVLAVLLVPTVIYAEDPISGNAREGMPVDQYRVVFNRDMVRGPAEVRTASHALAAEHDIEIIRIYDHVLGGFYGRMPRVTAEALTQLSNVLRVSYPGYAMSAQTTQNNPDWGLDRIDQRHKSLDNKYVYDFDAENLRVYVFDGGVRASHDDFDGRVFDGGNFADAGSATDDCSGHGTHVAGIVAGEIWGAAKKADIWSVRVIACDGKIHDLDWVITALNDHRSQGVPNDSVVNMSLQGPQDDDLDDAIDHFIDDTGVIVVHAAGNDNADACNFSPRTVKAISVGAANTNDARAPFPQEGQSNWGSCVDIFAPGIEIKSADNASDTATRTASGTSMAAPFVAAKVLLLIDQNSALAGDPSTLKERVITYNATHNVLDSATLPSGTPNKLMFSRDDLYRPDKGLEFSGCTGALANYLMYSNGNYGPESESYTMQVQRDSSANPWQTFSTSSSDMFQVNANSQFRVRVNYAVSHGTSPWNTSVWLTAPNCQ